jgi:two-component system, cell cycle sensor histidine kinase and response regulator CckA
MPLENALNRSLLHELPDAYLCLDRELRVIDLNASAGSLLRADSGDPVGAALGTVVAPSLAESISASCLRARREGRPVHTRERLEDGSRGRNLRIHALPNGYAVQIWDEAQPSSRGTGIPGEAEIARLREMESKLRESENRFRALIDRLEVGIFIVRRQRIGYANPHARRIFGYSEADQVAGGSLTGLIIEQDRASMQELINSCLSGDGASGQILLRGIRRDGALVEVEVQGIRTKIQGEPSFIGILVDVTERERTTALLREREEKLRHAQKLEAVGRLAGGIAHDFNNLLMVIQGSVNLILMESTGEDQHRSDLEEIVRATERAAELTRQLLAFGRKQVLRPKVISLNTALEDLNKLISRVIGADIELRTELSPDLQSVRVDPGQLEQVILNLVVNARDAMPGGGILTLRTEDWMLTEEDAARAPYRVLPGSYIRLTVSDTGFGMPTNVLSQAFEPFFTTKPRGKGTGLGLSTAYGIVKQSNGYIWLSSQIGRGTSVEIYLPRVEEKPEAPRASVAVSIPRGSGRVLLVEDQEPVRIVTRRLLEQGGYSVLEAASGHEAVQMYDECGGAVDLVLTDVIMPQMNGRELAAHLRARNPNLRLLYMSGYADNRAVRRGADGADDEYIQKPFTPKDLLSKMHSVLTE